jgi:hypothetical protein
MQATAEAEDMAKKRKKSEVRKHTGMLRIEADALEDAKDAARLMKKTLAEWATDVVRAAAKRDRLKGARKIVEEEGKT